MALTGIALLFASGCSKAGGPPKATVSGVVTVDGQPLEQGSINFVPIGDNAGPVSGGIITDGKFLISKGVAVGMNRVEIKGKQKSGNKIKPPPPAPQDIEIEELVEIVPVRYNKESILEVDVEAGTNEFDFPLDSN